MARQKNGGKGSRANQFSQLKDHKQKGKVLSPPLAHLGMTPTSWMNERVPEMLWAALLLEGLGRERALTTFRQVAEWFFRNAPPENAQPIGPMHSEIGAIPAEQRASLLSVIVSSGEHASVLSPLLLFPDMPASSDWTAVLGRTVRADGIRLLMDAVGKILWHQSQEATDCRWVRVVALLAQRKLVMPPDMAEQIAHYPNVGDQRGVRPMIRAAEINFSVIAAANESWAELFWARCLSNTDCVAKHQQSTESDDGRPLGMLFSSITAVRESVLTHEHRSRQGSGIDPRREASFGFAFYSLTLIEEVVVSGSAGSLLARLALRTLAELRITFSFLLTKDDPGTWAAYRKHGAGQAKLNFLKLADNAPSHISIDDLEHIANEDLWQELVDINLGQWTNSDLRKMSDEAGVKATYDSYYGWPSSYVHGQWSAVRESCYQNCYNPLHRLHRIPLHRPRMLPEALSDAVRLVNEVLDSLNVAYPGTFERLPSGADEHASGAFGQAAGNEPPQSR